MKMKLRCLCIVVLLMAVALTGCKKDFEKMVEKHKATSMQEDGIWAERFKEVHTDSANDDTTVYLSVNVLKDMTEEDMLAILDCVELEQHAKFKNRKYVGSKDGVFTCYAVFFRGDTDEEIKRIKYVDGKSVEITEDDEASFPKPEQRDSEDD